MSTISAALEQAKAYHRAGQLQRAEELYRAVVARDPAQAEAHYLLGATYQALGKLSEAVASLREATRLQPQYVHAHNHLGVALAQQGMLDEAIASFQHALRLMPEFAEARNNLQRAMTDRSRAAALDDLATTGPAPPLAEAHDPQGAALLRQGRFDEAVAHFQQVLQQNPQDLDAHYGLGNALREQGKLVEAVACYRRVLELKPDFAKACNSLGIALVRQRDLLGATACFREALRLQPGFVHAQTNLGNALREAGALEEALPYYREAVRLGPNLAEAHNNLGAALQDQGNVEEAKACYRRALELQPRYADAQANLGNALHDQGNLDDAIVCYRRALELKPDLVTAHDNYGKALQQQGELDEAAACYRQARRLAPQPWLYDLRIATMCPTIFPSSEAIERFRSRLLEELERFSIPAGGVDLTRVSMLACEPPFNLQFHGRNDRLLKRAYARLFREVFPEGKPLARSGRPRLGFVVTRKHEKLFLRSMCGVLERLRLRDCEVMVVCSRATCETIRSGIGSDRVGILPVPERFDHMVAAIGQARFDVLYYWEIGTDTMNYALPFFRLAPVQCTSWGIQVTSGIPQMDYYLSSVPVEPEGAADHYSEKLLLADALLSYQRRVAPPAAPKTREAFGLTARQHVYLCAQQLGKFHPDFDPLLAGILRQDERGVLVIANDRYGHVAGRLQQRFAVTMPDVAQRVVVVPYQPTADYLSLVAAADVLLDPLHFGGVNSSYDGFSLGKPIVTWPSQFQRGRYTLACYRKMGITACVAASAQQYVDIALRLGTDADFRAAIAAEIRQASPVLFEDLQAVREHERIFQALIEGGHDARTPRS